MKLILGSNIFSNKNVYNKLLEIEHIDFKKLKVLFIPNEKVSKEKLESNKYINRLIEWGFNKENIYVFNKYKPDNFFNLDIDIIIISGGNTFSTMKVLKDCNFDKEIIRYIKNGVLYIGESCGCHIVSKNIKHIEKYDENYVNLTDYRGLGLIDKIFICHYNESRKNDTDNIKNNEVITLTDDEFIIYENNKIKKFIK